MAASSAASALASGIFALTLEARYRYLVVLHCLLTVLGQRLQTTLGHTPSDKNLSTKDSLTKSPHTNSPKTISDNKTETNSNLTFEDVTSA